MGKYVTSVERNHFSPLGHVGSNRLGAKCKCCRYCQEIYSEEDIADGT